MRAQYSRSGVLFQRKPRPTQLAEGYWDGEKVQYGDGEEAEAPDDDVEMAQQAATASSSSGTAGGDISGGPASGTDQQQQQLDKK
eukprot:2881079-Alexandrium_andersonii.AAC.1